MQQYDTMKEYLTDLHIDDWDRKRQEPELWYVADDSGLVMLDDVDFETAYVYASKIENCNAYKKI